MAERLFPDLTVSDTELRAEYDRRAASPAPFPGVPAGLGVAVPSFAEVQAALRRRVMEERRRRLFAEWFDQQLRSADIRVDERYGRWDPERRVVR